MSDLHPSKPFPSKKTQNDETPLHLAAKFALLKLFSLFLEYGGNPGVGNSRDETCMHMVCTLSSNPMRRTELIDEIIKWRGIRSDNTTEKVRKNTVLFCCKLQSINMNY